MDYLNKRQYSPGKIRTLTRPREFTATGALRTDADAPDLLKFTHALRPILARFLNTIPIPTPYDD